MKNISEQLHQQLKGACHLKIIFKDDVYNINEGKKPTITITVKSRKALLSMLSGNELAMSESYIYGDIDLSYENPDDLLELLRIQDSLDRDATLATKASKLITGLVLKFLGTVSMNRRWLATHYSGACDTVIQHFVDSQYKLYSHGIGYEPGKELSLEQGAQNKLQWIYEACDLNQSKTVLDVGGGWGSFLKYAGARGARVHTIAVTDDSISALSNIKNEEKLNHCELEKINFWDVDKKGNYDAIVCLGTIEHLPYYQRLMEKANYLLKPGGKLHVDGFSVKKPQYEGSQFMVKYIYPGDNTPFFLDEFLAAVEKSTLVTETVKEDCYDYFRTMIGWSRKFEKNIEFYQSKGISEEIIRIFRIYLWGITSSYKYGKIFAYRAMVKKPAAREYFI